MSLSILLMQDTYLLLKYDKTVFNLFDILTTHSVIGDLCKCTVFAGNGCYA